MKRLLLACLTFPVSLLAEGGLPNQPYIYVKGEAEIQKPADFATMRFNAVGRSPELIKANREAQTKAIKILGMLDEKSVPKADVIASDIRTEPQYENQEGFKSGKIAGYVVTRPCVVKIRDLTIFSKLIEDLTAIGVEFSAIEPGLSNDKELQDEIWKKSLADARERANKALLEMAMKIDSVFAVSPLAFPSISQEIFGYEQSSNAVEGTRILPITAQYRLAPVTISQSVHVIYLISPAK